MFGRKKDAGKEIASLIGVGTFIEGNVYFQGGMRIDGHVRGNVHADADQPSMLVISEHGRIDGEIDVGHVVVNGIVNGPISASELLELQPKAQINGNVFYKALEMHPGAIVRGELRNEEDANQYSLKFASNDR